MDKSKEQEKTKELDIV